MHTRHFQQLPKAYLAYPKVIQSLIFKKTKQSQQLPQVKYVVDQLQVDQAHLKAYKQLTGFKDNGYVPAIYLAVLAQSLQMHMMTQEDFPFAMLGLVHIRNQVSQMRKIGSNEQISLSCKFGELRAHDKGLAFDFETVAKVGSEVVMQGVTTYLSRQKSAAAQLDKVPNTKSKDAVQAQYVSQTIWSLPENLGRRYAKISGDYNLIHIHALSAKAFGFKQAIAHGMWSKARALAQLNLPDAYDVDVNFKLPILLPSQVEFLTVDDKNQTDFLIQNQKNQKPHVAGQLKAR